MKILLYVGVMVGSFVIGRIIRDRKIKKEQLAIMNLRKELAKNGIILL